MQAAMSRKMVGTAVLTPLFMRVIGSPLYTAHRSLEKSQAELSALA